MIFLLEKLALRGLWKANDWTEDGHMSQTRTGVREGFLEEAQLTSCICINP